MTQVDTVPDSFDVARDALRLRLHGEVPLAVLQLELESAGAESAYPKVDPFGIVRYGVAVETAGAVVDVSEAMLAQWGVTSPPVFQAAIANLRGRDVSDIRRIGEGTYVFGDEAFSAGVVADPKMIDQFPVNGLPVLLAVAREGVFLTGSDDLDGMHVAADLGEKMLAAGAHPVSVTPLTVSDIFWSDQDWSWPAEVARSREVQLLQRRFRTILQARQKRAIDIGWDGVPVAEAQLVARPDGAPWTVATWVAGTQMWLPVVDEYLLTRDDGTVTPIPFETFMYNWSQRIHVTGTPPLYQVPADLNP